MKIHGLTVTNEYGTDLYLFLTEQEVMDELAKYVRDEWEREVNNRRGRDDQCPDRDDHAIEAYFDIVEDETFSVQETELDGVVRVVDKAKARYGDAEALDEMARLFSAMHWPGSSGLEDLAGIVRDTGRKIINDPDQEWTRH